MPPVMSIDNTEYQVRLKWMLHGQQCFNVLNFISRGSQDLINNLLVPVVNCVVTHLLPVLSHDVDFLGADVRNVTGTVAQEAEQPAGSTHLGTESTDSLPSTNAMVIALKTAHVGKTGRGRLFVPGIPESHQASSVVDATFIAAAVAFIACMASAFINGDPPATPFFDWAVRSRKDNTAYPVTQAIARPIIATLRSRKVH